ncbi:phosphoribosylformylglycinamidine synthase subunit PurL [Caldiplasma sukawensis]
MPSTESFYNQINIIGKNELELMEINNIMRLGLSVEEMIRLRNYFEKLGREPTETELQAMGQAWSEHCCYKSSKFYLKKFFSGFRTEDVILAMEDDAGIMKVSDDLAYAVKMESHNHPSAVEPYGGAATGVGGIIRDVLCMGAQPIALIDSLYLGNGKNKKRKSFLNFKFINENVVGGIRDYGNRVGIPTIAGSLWFSEHFDGIPLVNAGCLGIMKINDLCRSRVGGVGEILILAGGRTGRDGIHGVNFASRGLIEDNENRKAVQLGNPIVKEPLIHAILEANQEKLISGMKDLGGGGLSSASGEMCLSGNTGAEIDLSKVILKEKDMEPWEIWISESQERMLLSVKVENVERIREIFENWGIEYSVIGKTVSGERMKLFYNDRIVMDLSLRFLTEGPVYARPYIQKFSDEYKIFNIINDPADWNGALLSVIGDSNVGSRAKVIRQYDHTVRGDTVLPPLSGFPNRETHSDSSAIIVDRESRISIGVSSSSSVNFTSIHPYNGTLLSVCRVYRNLICGGFKPHAIIDSINFGDPENMLIMGEIVNSIKAISDFSKIASIPVISGNVSLYNKIDNENIPAVPNVLMTGVLKGRYPNSPEFKEEGNSIYFVGSGFTDLSGSFYSIINKIGSEYVDKPDINSLIKISNLILEGLERELILSVHDVSQGGLGVAIVEMSLGLNLGADIDLTNVSNSPFIVKLFSENGNGYVLEVRKNDEENLINLFKGFNCVKIGYVGGEMLNIKNNGKCYISLKIEELRKHFDNALDTVL